MLFSYNWLNEYVKGELPEPKDLARALALHIFEVEGIEKKGEDTVLDLEMTANRVADASSHFGLARECAAILELGLNLPQSVRELKTEKKPEVKVEVKVEELCPRYMTAEMKGVEVGPSPLWIKKRLLACGLQPINNVVDGLNYVMLETGQPLHGFDLETLNQKKILVRKAGKGEVIETLDGKKVKLNTRDLVIADGERGVAIAGIKGGKKTGVEKGTRKIVIEAANFDPVSVRKTSQRIKMRTDASYRFEHGPDPNLAEKGLKRAVYLLKEVASAELAAGSDFYPQPVKPKRLRLRPVRVENLLGTRIEKEEIVSILEGLGFGFRNEDEKGMEFEIPTRRRDIFREEDLVEEVGRIYGYNRIPARMPRSVLVPAKRNVDVFWQESARDGLKQAGMTEVYNYSFISKKQARVFGFGEQELVEVANPLSKKYRFLAPTLLCHLLENASTNVKHFDRFRLFELGKIFKKKSKGEVEEKRALSGVVVKEEGDKETFLETKGIIAALFSDMGINKGWYDDFEPRPESTKAKIWEQGRTAEVKVGEEELGFLGILSKDLVRRKGIKAGIAGFCLDFERLQTLASEKQEFEPVSPYPKASRDLAVLVPRGVKVAEVLNVINVRGGELVRDVDLFDIYEGEELPEGKKNLAFHVIYQAEDRTLDSGEIENLHQEIMSGLEKEGWEVRK